MSEVARPSRAGPTQIIGGNADWRILYEHSPLVERVYVDMECSIIGAIVPATAFRWLIRRDQLEEFAKTYVRKPGWPRIKRNDTKRSPKWQNK